MKAEFLTNLSLYRPCTEAFEWAGQFGLWQELWDKCERGDWMLWIIGKTAVEADRKHIVSIACECARLVLPYTKDPRVLKCIEVTEAWVRGEATIEQVREARDATYAAYATYATYADADAADAAYATYAAADAADATYADADAADAAAAATYATYATYADADAAARKQSLQKSADIVRRYYPVAPVLKSK